MRHVDVSLQTTRSTRRSKAQTIFFPNAMTTPCPRPTTRPLPRASHEMNIQNISKKSLFHIHKFTLDRTIFEMGGCTVVGGSTVSISYIESTKHQLSIAVSKISFPCKHLRRAQNFSFFETKLFCSKKSISGWCMKNAFKTKMNAKCKGCAM